MTAVHGPNYNIINTILAQSVEGASNASLEYNNALDVIGRQAVSPNWTFTATRALYVANRYVSYYIYGVSVVEDLYFAVIKALLHDHMVELVTDTMGRVMDPVVRKVMERALFMLPSAPTFGQGVRLYAKVDYWGLLLQSGPSQQELTPQAQPYEEQLARLRRYVGDERHTSEIFESNQGRIREAIIRSDERAKRYEYYIVLEIIDELFQGHLSEGADEALKRLQSVVRSGELTALSLETLEQLKSDWTALQSDARSFESHLRTVEKVLEDV